MTQSPKSNEIKTPNQFEELKNQASLSLVQEFWQFIVENRAWWMIPILLVIGLIGLLVMLSSTGAAPFIYTLF